jgi:hypothetical protein
MRRFAWLALAGALTAGALPAGAQIAAPAGWRAETFAFPLPFAPSIPYEGTEHVRFSPSWARFADDDGFTYVVLWELKRKPLEPAELERALDVYFDGLMEAVTKARKIADPGTVSQVSLHPLDTPDGWATALGGRVWTWNGFSKGEALVLNLEIAQRACAQGRTQVFFALSKAARTHATWNELRRIRGETGCEAPAPAAAAKPK